MILGLDISTSTIGFTILSREGKFQTASYIELSKEKNIFRKAEILEKRLKFIKDQYHITKIFVEDRLQAFTKGLSSAWTLNLLTYFQGVCSIILFQIFKLEPEFINPNTARKIVLGKAREKGVDTKKMVLDWAKKEFKSFKWEYAKTGSDKKYSFDIADSMVIASAGYKLLNEEK